MRQIRAAIGQAVGRYLSQPIRNYRPLTTSPPSALATALAPGDVLLVEGNTRVSGAIKYLTQSTWSHAALYIGDALQAPADTEEQPVPSRGRYGGRLLGRAAQPLRGVSHSYMPPHRTDA